MNVNRLRLKVLERGWDSKILNVKTTFKDCPVLVYLLPDLVAMCFQGAGQTKLESGISRWCFCDIRGARNMCAVSGLT